MGQESDKKSDALPPSSPSFGPEYARIYDLLYKDKNYSGEAEYILALLKQYSSKNIDSVLEVGCGTGGHAPFFSKGGMRYQGVDRSTFMVDLAKAKYPGLDFHVSDVTKMGKTGHFDCCVSLFHSFGYISDLDHVELALGRIRANLNPSGIFIFDAWNGLSVLASPPAPTFRKVQTDDGREVLRYSESTVDWESNLVTIKFEVFELEGQKIGARFQENHVMRYYFPGEISYILQKNGFKQLAVLPFMKLAGTATSSDRGIVIVSKLVD
jgi:SAM-dependent methyltransferase